MKALVYEAPREFRITEIATPPCGDNQVLIKVKSCGICKTDVHIHHGSFISRFPLTPGHEFAGVIEKVGADVHGFRQGDRVVADNTVLCGECYYCRRNQPLYCENFYSLGVTGPGGFAEYVAVNQDKVFPISDKLSYDQAALTEPTACAVHGLDVMDIRPGDDILLFGAGPTGIILAQLLRHGGAGKLVIAAPTQFKLDVVQELTAGETVKIDRGDFGASHKEIGGISPKGFDVIIDATGAASITKECLKYAKMGAKIVVYGVCGEDDRIDISPYEIFSKELKIIGSFAQTHCFDRAIKYLEDGMVKVDQLITHRYRLDDYEAALNTVIDGSNSLKVMINP